MDKRTEDAYLRMGKQELLDKELRKETETIARHFNGDIPESSCRTCGATVQTSKMLLHATWHDDIIKEISELQHGTYD